MIDFFKKKPDDRMLFQDKEKLRVAEKILSEEGVPFSGDTFSSLVLSQYGSSNSDNLWVIQELYSGNIPLREAIYLVVSQYYSNTHPDIQKVPILIKAMIEILKGCDWAKEWNPSVSGDYKPENPENWLDGMYTLLEAYNTDHDSIDILYKDLGETDYLKDVPKGDHGGKGVITSSKLYNMAENGWFTDEAKEIKQKLMAHIPPSECLEIVLENWEFYVNPQFQNINHFLEYCVLCADRVPDTSENRILFRHALMEMSQ